MIRISTQMITERSLSAMLRQQSDLSNTQLQLSSGRRVLTPADDPASAVRVLGLNGAVETVSQYQNNIDRLTSRLETEEGALDGITNLLQRVRELTVQGNNDVLSATDKGAIALEVRQLRDQLFSMANAKDSNGEYIFSGYQTGTPPFNAGDYIYYGDNGQRELQIAPGRTIADGDNGFDVFMNVASTAPPATPRRSVFETLDNLALALEANTSVGDYITDVDLALQRVIETKASVGGRLNAIEEQKTVNEDLKLNLETQRSDEQDLDYTSAIARFEAQMTALQAAQQAFVKVKGLSLFNYL
ncbi:flagellar hook-associated protein FlgL [Sedimenticola hydrogenitrophicus]|uniref:flagellar hook-associated protein FlgL n=1 Tax=Sedimenticola hydrogenitrophicus TaxID=2967975 RepID=UPI0023AEE6DC|nr:flagellar hook-associated protein FlgL [Sedimenticola hydrogenitrophicus]